MSIESKSERLFSYGTLRLAGVQLASFGRVLDGSEDAVLGYRLDWLTVTDFDVVATSGTDRHPVLRRSGDAGSEVDGIVFEISEAELAAADEYEVSDYVRVLAPLRSGGDAWVYVAVDAER